VALHMGKRRGSGHGGRGRPSLDTGSQYNPYRETPEIREAIDAAPPPPCPSAKGLYVFCQTTGRAFPVSCKRWTCPACSERNRLLAFWVIEEGMCLAFEGGLKVRWIVLTSPAEGMDPAGLRSAWDRLRERLRYGGHYESFAVTVEVERGRPHLNVITVGGKSIWQKRLGEIAAKVGFGAVAWIRSVTPTEDDARRLAWYITKGAAEAVRWARRSGSKQFRPVRLSRSWRPFGLTEARRSLPEALGLPSAVGPFVRVRVGGGRLRIVGEGIVDPGGVFR
jgi:hypothetical protein